MPYGKSDNTRVNVNELKKKISEKMPNIDVDNMSTNDMKDLLVNQINSNKNLNIDDSVKEKINKGDIDGLKEDIINYLSKNETGNGANDKIVNMLKKNDMDGLKNELMGMLMNNIGSQKKMK